MELEKLTLLIENAISELGADAVAARSGQDNQWDLVSGKIHIMIDAFEVGQNTYFQAIVKLAEIADNDFIFGKLLEQNHTLIDLSITKYKNTIYLKSILHGEYLDVTYIKYVLNKISDYAEKFIILIDAMLKNM